MNEGLKALYAEHWREFAKGMNKYYAANAGLSNPLLLHVFEEYHRSPRRLLIVGQQTRGWDDDHKNKMPFKDIDPTLSDPEEAIAGIIDLYRDFHLGEKYYHSPFWSKSTELQFRINPTSPIHGFMWTNIVRLDQQGKRPNREIEDEICRLFPVLVDEIRILRPDIVVFFIGPYYHGRLNATFPGLIVSVIKNLPTNLLGKLEHQWLPYHSYVTYHPNYLQRSKQWEKVCDSILGQLQG